MFYSTIPWVVLGAVGLTTAHPLVERGTLATAPSPAYLGCYSDSSTRTLIGPATTTYTNTPTTCRAFCATQGYSYAGVEYSGQVRAVSVRMPWLTLPVLLRQQPRCVAEAVLRRQLQHALHGKRESRMRRSMGPQRLLCDRTYHDQHFFTNVNHCSAYIDELRWLLCGSRGQDPEGAGNSGL